VGPALALLLAAAPPRTGVAPRVAAALAAGHEAGGPRAAAATQPLHGLPYAQDPLGEGSGPDPDPRFRLDAFDCMTFVETAAALGASTTLDEARRALDEIRYDGAPSLAARNHEVLSQWIPANLRKGFIRPLPAGLLAGAAPPAAAAVEYDEARWGRLARLGLALRGVTPQRLPLGRFEVPVIPPDAFVALGPALPDGTLAFVVREDRPDRPTRVTHAGLVVAAPGPGHARLVRHATSSAGVTRVIEEPLDRFVARQRAASRRPLTGFALYLLGVPAGTPPVTISRPEPP